MRRPLDGRVGNDDSVNPFDRGNCISYVIHPVGVEVWGYLEDKLWTSP